MHVNTSRSEAREKVHMTKAGVGLRHTVIRNSIFLSWFQDYEHESTSAQATDRFDHAQIRSIRRIQKSVYHQYQRATIRYAIRVPRLTYKYITYVCKYMLSK